MTLFLLSSAATSGLSPKLRGKKAHRTRLHSGLTVFIVARDVDGVPQPSQQGCMSGEGGGQAAKGIFGGHRGCTRPKQGWAQHRQSATSSSLDKLHCPAEGNERQTHSARWQALQVHVVTSGPVCQKNSPGKQRTEAAPAAAGGRPHTAQSSVAGSQSLGGHQMCLGGWASCSLPVPGPDATRAQQQRRAPTAWKPTRGPAGSQPTSGEGSGVG